MISSLTVKLFLERKALLPAFDALILSVTSPALPAVIRTSLTSDLRALARTSLGQRTAMTQRGLTQEQVSVAAGIDDDRDSMARRPASACQSDTTEPSARGLQRPCHKPVIARAVGRSSDRFRPRPDLALDEHMFVPSHLHADAPRGPHHPRRRPR